MTGEGRGGRCKRSERPSDPTPPVESYRLPQDVDAALRELAQIILDHPIAIAGVDA